MQLCVPVVEDRGLESRVSGHFDRRWSRCPRVIVNNNAHHAHGMCHPIAALAGERVDGMVVGGIGMGALMKLQAAGITVYQATRPTVREAVTAFQSGALQPIDQDRACAGHHHHGGGR